MKLSQKGELRGVGGRQEATEFVKVKLSVTAVQQDGQCVQDVVPDLIELVVYGIK